MSCSNCKKKGRPKKEIIPEKEIKENITEKDEYIEYKKEYDLDFNNVIEYKNEEKSIYYPPEYVPTYPSVDELRLLDYFFKSRYKQNYKEANEVFKKIFNGSEIGDCRGCVSRSERMWNNFIGDMLTDE